LLAQIAYANKINVMDTPTTKIIEYGSYEADFKIFNEGGVTPRLIFGVFSFLDLGISWEVQNLVGYNQAYAAVPALHAKAQIYSGNMSFPAIAAGYDGQGYMHKRDANDRYFQDPKGLYLVIGREVISEGILMNLGVNSNTLRDGEVYCFLNLTAPLGSDSFLFMAELDNIKSFSDSRINLGLRIMLSDSIMIDLMVRDCWGSKEESLYPNDRILGLSYTGQF
ncbi:MAG: hypothetical protein LBV66_03420, partial [Elusimicrobiota bacterium]|nr:hypothetical protein [Elusimicrobiota bacterium]